MNLNVLLKLEKLTWAHADFANIIYKTLDICSQHKKKKEKKKKAQNTGWICFRILSEFINILKQQG